MEKIGDIEARIAVKRRRRKRPKGVVRPEGTRNQQAKVRQ